MQMTGEKKEKGNLDKEIHPTSNRAFLKMGYIGGVVSFLWLYREPRCPSETASGG